MKKLLNLFIIGLFLSVGLVAQTSDFQINYDDYKTYNPDGSVDFDFESFKTDVEDNNLGQEAFIPLIMDSSVIDDVDFSEVLPDITDEDLASIETSLAEQGYETETITSVKTVVKDLSTGKTLGTIKQEDPAKFETIENVLVKEVSKQAVSGMFDAETKKSLEDALGMVDSAISFLNGFAQSTVNSSVASSLFGYQGYKLLALSVGTLGSFSLNDPVNTAQEIMNIAQGDNSDVNAILDQLSAMNLSAGVTLQGLSASAGLNLGFLVDGLYVSAVAGSLEVILDSLRGVSVEIFDNEVFNTGEPLGLGDGNTPMPAINISMLSKVMGIKGNYQLIQPVGIPVLFRWNGISVGSGLIYTDYNIVAKVDVSPVLKLPKNTLATEFSILSTGVTVPLEASTGLQLLSIATVTVGAAADLVVGTSSINLDMNLGDGLGAKIIKGVMNEVLGDLSLPYSNQSAPLTFVNPRLSAGVGLGIGPLVIDISAHYFLNTGIAAGINFVIRI